MDSAANIDSPKPWLSRGWIITLVAIGVIGIAGFSLWGYANSLWNTGVQKEAQLSAQYSSNQNYLSAYISGFYEQLGVANLKSEKLDKILTDAVKGRYDGKGTSLANVITEAYPQLGDLSIYDRIVDYIRAGREGYRNIQDKLLDQLANYDTWRGTGILQHWLVSMRYPSDGIRACIGANCVTGFAALDRMRQIVIASQAGAAYESGVMDPLTVPKN